MTKRTFTISDPYSNGLPYNIEGFIFPHLKLDTEKIADYCVYLDMDLKDYLLTQFHHSPDKIIVESPTKDRAIEEIIERYINGCGLAFDGQYNTLNSLIPVLWAGESWLIMTALDVAKDYPLTGPEMVAIVAGYIGYSLNKDGCEIPFANANYLKDALKGKEIIVRTNPKNDIDPIVDNFNNQLRKIGPKIIDDAKKDIIENHGYPEKLELIDVAYDKEPRAISRDTEKMHLTVKPKFLCEQDGIMAVSNTEYEIYLFNGGESNVNNAKIVRYPLFTRYDATSKIDGLNTTAFNFEGVMDPDEQFPAYAKRVKESIGKVEDLFLVSQVNPKTIYNGPSLESLQSLCHRLLIEMM